MSRITVSREALYDLVWSKPSEAVAKDLGISGVALGKLCARRNVPKPPRDSWARSQAGKKVQRPPLHTSESPVVRPIVPKVAFVPPVVPGGLRSHPLVRASRDAARDQKPDTFGHVVVVPQAGRVALRATPAGLPRALFLAHLVLTGAAAAGLEVTETPRVGVRVEGELFMLRVKEWSRKLDVPVERPGSSTYSREYTRAEGTGRLELRLEESRAPLPRLKWTDGKRPLEEQVPDLLRALLDAGPIIVAWRARLAAEQRQEQEEQARKQRVRAAEDRRLREELWIQADAWGRSQGLEAYLAAVEAHLIKRRGVLSSEAPEARWLAWARRTAWASDPLRSGMQEDGLRRWLALQTNDDNSEQKR